MLDCKYMLCSLESTTHGAPAGLFFCFCFCFFACAVP